MSVVDEDRHSTLESRDYLVPFSTFVLRVPGGLAEPIHHIHMFFGTADI